MIRLVFIYPYWEKEPNCFVCKKPLPKRFWNWSNSYADFCSHKCWKNHPSKKIARGTHGGQWYCRLYSFIGQIYFKLDLIRILKDWDGMEFWGCN